MAEEDEELKYICRDIAGRQRYRPGPKKLADLLSTVMAKKGYAAMQSSADCADAWQKAVGPELSPETLSGTIRRGVLEVYVRNSAVLQELTFRQKALLADLAQAAPQLKIRKIRFRVDPLK